MYHRIADEPVDCYYMTVSPSRFKEHLDVLRRIRHPLSLGDFVSDFMAGTLRHDAVAVTFDDGYVDNLIDGKPLLAAADIPATVFLTTGYVDRPENFWWDELARLLIFEESPQRFELVVRRKTVMFDFGTESPAREDGTTPAALLKRRHDALSMLWETLRSLDDQERRSIIAKLQSIFANRDHRACLGRAMTGDEVRALVADGLVTVGAHTVTHPVLAGLGAATCYKESFESKLACEALIGAPVVAFSYPYGDYDAEACEAVKAAGFIFACGKQGGPIMAKSDVFALPRIYVPNIDGDAFERFLHLASAASFLRLASVAS